MHSIITSQGFVIDSRPYGEAGKLLYIFTRDQGLIMATAQGIRLEKSKLRYFVQDYSFGTFSFVKGKEYWRLTNAQESQKIRSKVEGGRSKEEGDGELESGGRMELMARVALLLKKLLHGEEANPELFRVLYNLNDYEIVDKSLESLVVLRIFHRLGYIGNIGELNSLLITDDITEGILKVVEKNIIFINKHINKAIKESHL